MNIISYEKRALRVFAKNCREVFEVGVWEPSNGREPEMSRLLPITDTLLHTAPTYLWKHRNILTSDSLPLAANFYICCQHLPLNAATAASSMLLSSSLLNFSAPLRLLGGGSAVFGTIGPFYESQHPLQAPAPSLLSAHLRLCYCWWWWTWWWCWWWWWWWWSSRWE